jgi:hypothetical protein
MYTFLKNSKVSNILQEELWVDADAKRLKRIWRLSTNASTTLHPSKGTFTLALLSEGIDLDTANTAKVSNLDFVLPILETGPLDDGDGYFIIHPYYDEIMSNMGSEGIAGRVPDYIDQIVNMYTQLKAAGYYKIEWMTDDIVVDETNKKLYIYGFVPLSAISADTTGSKKTIELDTASENFASYSAELVSRIQAVINS